MSYINIVKYILNEVINKLQMQYWQYSLQVKLDEIKNTFYVNVIYMKREKKRNFVKLQAK